MHILITVFFNSPMGGLHLNILDTVKALKKGGHTVTLLSKEGIFSQRASTMGVNTIITDYKDINESVQAVLKNIRKPFDLIHAHPFHSREVGQVLSKKLKIPFIVTLHSINDPLVSSYIDEVDALIVVSEWIKDRIVHPKIAPSNKVFVVPNGVDINYLKRKAKEKYNQNNFNNFFSLVSMNILVVSRFDEDKLFLIDSIIYVWENILKYEKFDTNWVLAGDGTSKERLELLANKINEKAKKTVIHFVGWQNIEKLAYLYSKADLFIGPGRTILEAMVFGVPCIALGSKGYIGTIHSDNLFQGIYTNFGGDKTVEKLDTTLLYKDLELFLEYDKDDIEQLQKLSTSTVNTFFNLTEVNNKLLNIYKMVVNKESISKKESAMFEMFDREGFELKDKPYTVEFNVREETRYYISGLVYNRIEENSDSSLISIDFQKRLSNIDLDRSQLPVSDHVGYYKYLSSKKGVHPWILEIYIPKNVHKIMLNFRTWKNKHQAIVWNKISIVESVTSKFFDQKLNSLLVIKSDKEKIEIELNRQIELLKERNQNSQIELKKSNAELELIHQKYQNSQIELKKSNAELELIHQKYQNSQIELKKSNAELESIHQKYQNSQIELEKSNAELELIHQKYQNSQIELKKSNAELMDKNRIFKGEKYLLEQKLKQAYQTVSFRVGYEIIQSRKSFSRLIRLPKAILDIKKEQKKQIRVNERPVIESNKSIDVRTSNCISKDLKKGISVIVPSYKGEKYIYTLLNSLKKQDFSKNMYEIIIVLNGKLDNSKNIIESFHKNNSSLNIKMVIIKDTGASIARNRAIELASFKYMVLIDDDDTVSENYLGAMYSLADEKSIVISQIINIDELGHKDGNTPMNNQILSAKLSLKNPFNSFSSVLTINACKLIPTCYMKNIVFDISLKSGEDVVYFSELFSNYKFDFKICSDAIYYRLLKNNSVSRQQLSFNFNIKQRIAIINKLDKILQKSLDEHVRHFIKNKIHAQISFMNSYIIAFEDEYEKVKETIEEANIDYFPFSLLNKGFTKELVISYCFTPYVDTSAIVMAKRIREKGKVVDVVYNKMDSVREVSTDLFLLSDDLIDKRIVIDTPSSFSNWNAINSFSTKTFKELKLHGKEEYTKVYSRALWPASHFVAFEYKFKYPSSYWSAEFSDPILYDIHGQERYAQISGVWYFKEIENEVKKRKKTFVKNDNLFFWCEYLPYLFADELVFTNQYQLDYMIKVFPINDIKQDILSKAVIKEHPTLAKKYYLLESSSYTLSPEKVNLAYFGAFYQTRKLNDIIEAVKLLDRSLKQKIKIHIFTNTKDELEQMIIKEKLDDCFVLNDYVGFFEFLNLTIKFDCLIINDAITKPNKSINPYLPSKLSDYLGSKTDIWALYEKGSSLSKKSFIKYRSELLNIEQSSNVLKKIVSDYK